MSASGGTEPGSSGSGAAAPEPAAPVIVLDRAGRLPIRSVALNGLFILASFYAIYFARDVLVPLVVALVLHLLLSPAVRALARAGIPDALGALLALVVLVGALGTTVYALASPAAEWLDRMPQIARELEGKLEQLRKPVEDVTKASEQVEEMADVGSDSTLEVVVKGPGLLEELAGQVGEIAVVLAATVILAYFLLASGDLIRLKLVRVSPRLQDKKRALQIVNETEQQVSSYLLLITLVNLGVGAVVGAGMFLIGLPNALLWGALATFLSFIPFVGAWIGIASLGLVALLSFDSLGQAALAPAIYAVTHMIAENFVTPAVLGRRLTLNPVAIVLNVILWAWLWGVPGALLAGPILVAVKVLCDNIASLGNVAELLGGQQPSGKTAQEPTTA